MSITVTTLLKIFVRITANTEEQQFNRIFGSDLKIVDLIHTNY